MFSCQFCKIFKRTFFIEHPRWLLLPILKRLDSHRQLCKRISKLVTIYFISTSLILVAIFVFILASTRFPFTSRRPCAWRNLTFLYFSRDHTIEVSRDFLDGSPSSSFSILPSFGGQGPCECRDKTFWTWQVTTWLCRWGPLILSHHPAKFGVHRPCESGNITLFICHVTTILKCHVICGWGRLTLSHHHAKFGEHRPCDSGDVKFLICHVTL